MDKQMIEEMAKDIAKRDCSLWENCPKEPKRNCVSQDPEIMIESSKNYITIATWLVNVGYRKITEGSVVLTRQEICKTCEEIATEMVKKARKETAEKFAERLKARYIPPLDEWDEISIGSLFYDIDEIAKEIKEGK